MYTKNLLKLFRNGRNNISKKHYSSGHHEDEYILAKDGRRVKVVCEPVLYRNHRPPVTTGPRIKLRTVLGTLQWYFVFYSFWHWPEYLLGEYYRPDMSKWTNEELGVPSVELDDVYDN